MSKKQDTRRAWLAKNPKIRRAIRRDNYRRGAEHSCYDSGQIWTSQADGMILNPKRPHDRVTAVALGRTVQAIQVRRTRLLNGRKKEEESASA